MAIQPTGNRGNANETGGRKISWRGIADGSANVMNGASMVYAMTRMLIGPPAIAPQAPADVFSAPANNTELPNSLPKPGKKKKLSGGAIGGGGADAVSGDPPPGKDDDQRFTVDKAQFDKWRAGMRDMDDQRQRPTRHRGLGL